jgi:hypothetical protein
LALHATGWSGRLPCELVWRQEVYGCTVEGAPPNTSMRTHSRRPVLGGGVRSRLRAVGFVAGRSGRSYGGAADRDCDREPVFGQQSGTRRHGHLHAQRATFPAASAGRDGRRRSLWSALSRQRDHVRHRPRQPGAHTRLQGDDAHLEPARPKCTEHDKHSGQDVFPGVGRGRRSRRDTIDNHRRPSRQHVLRG